MQILITLTTAGIDTGPFDLYSNVDGYTIPVLTGLDRITLVNGYTAAMPDGTTEILLRSTGVCERDLYLNVSGASTTTTTTSTTSTTTTAIPTTVQLDWNVGNQSGGQLTVYNNAMSIILDITSTAGSSQSGTIYPLISELPYTIRGQWVAGSGNIVRYNLCDLIGGGLVYASGAITNVEGYEDYLASPTPTYALVNLRAQNVLPPSCPL